MSTILSLRRYKMPPIELCQPTRWELYWHRHGKSTAIVAVLLAVTVVVATINIAGFPMRFKDEGVYLSQAWAIQSLGQLANYTYWYDHPPVGWFQLSLWTIMTDGFGRYANNPLVAGREFMVVVRMAIVVLMFILARRIGMRRLWAGFAIALFALSPLSVQFGRYVLLDSIALPWIIAGFVLAYSPKRRMTAAIGSAVCFTVGVLTKETMIVVAPALIWALWSNYRGSSNRKYVMWSWPVVTLMLIGFYPMYAFIKSEFFAGAGHVSLLQAIEWQLVNRAGSGSVFNSGSDAHHTMNVWLNSDYLLPLIGAVTSVVALGSKRLRPIAVATLIQLLLLLRTGYLPFMYIIGLLPFMALVAGGVGDWLWPRFKVWQQQHGWRLYAQSAFAAITAVAVVLFIAKAANPWRYTLEYQFTVDADQPERQAVNWVTANVPRDAKVVVEGESWLDYVSRGYSRSSVIWVYKIDTDPEVQKALGIWKNIDYLVLSGVTLVSQDKTTFPQVFQAVDNAQEIKTFGTGEDRIVVMKVRK